MECDSYHSSSFRKYILDRPPCSLAQPSHKCIALQVAPRRSIWPRRRKHIPGLLWRVHSTTLGLWRLEQTLWMVLFTETLLLQNIRAFQRLVQYWFFWEEDGDMGCVQC